MTEGYYDYELLLDGNVVKDGNVLPPESFDLSVNTDDERHPEPDEETTQADNQQGTYTPGTLEATVDNYRDQIGPHRQVSNQETTQTHNQHPAYVPGPLETRLENYKDRVGPYRQQSDKEACAECGIIYKDLLAEQAASIAAMNAVDTFAANSIAKARRNK